MNKDIFEENDRNIRVFGLETQKKLFESEVLILNITPMTSELCKNLILSGAGICIFENGSKITKVDLEANFFFNVNDLGKSKVEILKEKIKTFKESCRISIINEIKEINDKKIKYGVIDLSNECLNKKIIKELEKIMMENKGILYYIKIENDKAIFFNNILEKKFLAEYRKNELTRFVKDEKIIDHLELSDDEIENNNNEDKKENDTNAQNNKDKMKVVEITINNDEEEKKENEVLKEDDYTFLDFDNKIKEVKDLIPKNMKKFDGQIIKKAFKVIDIENNSAMNKNNPLNCLSNYVIGGVVCNEIINCISKTKNPRTNIYYYDAFNGTGKFINEIYDKVLE